MLAAAFALVAVIFMIIAIATMVTGRGDAHVGGLIRLIALVCFVAAVIINVAAH